MIISDTLRVMRGVIFYTIGIAFTSGIFFRSFLYFGTGEILLICLIGVASLVAWRLTVKATGLHGMPILLVVTVIGVSFAGGAWRMHIEETTFSPLEVYEEKQISLIGRVIREPEERATTMHVYVTPVGTEDMHDETVLVITDRFQSETQSLSYGDVVNIQGKLTHPEAFETDGGRTFNYEGYLRARGVRYTMSFAEVRVEQKDQGSFLGYIFAGKHAFTETVERIVPEPYAGLGEGVLLGVKRAIPESLEQTFRETGIIHIVVLSGYNIMIVVHFFMLFLSYVFFPRTRMFVVIGAIILFALLVGPSASVIRASVMSCLLVIAQGTGRTYAVLRALMLAGVIMLMINPYLLVHDPGFQLSFLATLGIILLFPHIEKRLTIIPEKFGIRNIATATLATQIFVLPLLLYHTGMFSTVALIVNILVLPMVPVAMTLTFVTGILGMISNTLGFLSGYLAYLSLGYVTFIAELFGSIPFASFQVNTFPFWIVLGMYALYVVGVWLLIMHDTKNTEEFEIKKESKSVLNDYEGWTIVEEKYKTLETQSVSNNAKRDTFPFR